MKIFQKFANAGFIHNLLSGADGGVSSTRVIIVVCFAFILGISGGLVHAIKGPVSLPDYGNFLVSAGNFLATACGPLYLVNKGAEVLNRNTDQNSNSTSNNVTVVVPPQTPAATK